MSVFAVVPVLVDLFLPNVLFVLLDCRVDLCVEVTDVWVLAVLFPKRVTLLNELSDVCGKSQVFVFNVSFRNVMFVSL